MINPKNFKLFQPSDLDNEIARLYKLLSDAVPGTARYKELVDLIEQLTKLKTEKSKNKVSSDVLVGALTNLLGILIVIKHEEINVIGGKAFSLVSKAKV
jgi:hypothetical protein